MGLPLGPPMPFLYTLETICYKVVHLTLSLITTGSMLMIFLFCLPHQISYKPFEIFKMVFMLTCHLHLKVKSKIKCPFLMFRLLVKVKHLRPLSTANLTFAEFFTHFDNFLPSAYNFDAV